MIIVSGQILEATETEIRLNRVFEEILHRLPEVQHLEVRLFSPFKDSRLTWVI